MISSSGLHKFFFLVLVVGASSGQMRQAIQQHQQQQLRQQHPLRDHNEHAPVPVTSQFQDYAYFLIPNTIEYNDNSLPPLPSDLHPRTGGRGILLFDNNEFRKPFWPILQHLQRATGNEKENGNGNRFSAREIAMEMFLPNIENPDDDAFEFAKGEENNIRRSIDVHGTGIEKYGRPLAENSISPNPNWHETRLNYDYDDDDDADDAIYDDDDDANHAAALRLSNVAAINATAEESDDSFAGNFEMEMPLPLLKTSVGKRNPLAFITNRKYFERPYFPIAYSKKKFGVDTKRSKANSAILFSNKRERSRPLRTSYIPSISTEAITHLGHFFNDLSKNVRFNERNEFREAEAKLLQGDHPLHMLQDDVAADTNEQSKIDKTADFLQSIRSYRPSQKIRSLVSMNPQGYHGSNFLDPNYMWVGLG